jgi:hypothetical protein
MLLYVDGRLLDQMTAVPGCHKLLLLVMINSFSLQSTNSFHIYWLLLLRLRLLLSLQCLPSFLRLPDNIPFNCVQNLVWMKNENLTANPVKNAKCAGVYPNSAPPTPTLLSRLSASAAFVAKCPSPAASSDSGVWPARRASHSEAWCSVPSPMPQGWFDLLALTTTFPPRHAFCGICVRKFKHKHTGGHITIRSVVGCTPSSLRVTAKMLLNVFFNANSCPLSYHSMVALPGCLRLSGVNLRNVFLYLFQFLWCYFIDVFRQPELAKPSLLVVLPAFIDAHALVSADFGPFPLKSGLVNWNQVVSDVWNGIIFQIPGGKGPFVARRIASNSSISRSFCFRRWRITILRSVTALFSSSLNRAYRFRAASESFWRRTLEMLLLLNMHKGTDPPLLQGQRLWRPLALLTAVVLGHNNHVAFASARGEFMHNAILIIVGLFGRKRIGVELLLPGIHRWRMAHVLLE